MVVRLTKQSTAPEIRCYFEGVLSLSQSKEEFPVNLDDVWPLAFAYKHKAVEKLRDSKLFIEGIDYKVLRTRIEQNIETNKNDEEGLFTQTGEKSGVYDQNWEKVKMGRPSNIYMLSVPCLEFFIARKVRSVFEVYRKVFHKVASGECSPLRKGNIGMSLEETLAPLAQYNSVMAQRWRNVINQSKDNSSICCRADQCEDYYRAYRSCINDLVYAETVARIEGIEAIQ